MKKTLVTAITTALVVGAASTTFAAANPFSDVPRDNWAYDAVTKLAQDGVVNGYGDGSFRGDATITRYEMAQIVAKAMAKTDVSAADKATIDKLAAEYADELNNLGVRVDNLEKKVDNVKFTGEARYRYTSDRHDDADRINSDAFLFRLEPTAQINDNWAAKARMDWTSNLDTDSDATHNTEVKRVYVEGKLFGADTKLGKLPTYSAQGMLIDDSISGAEFTFGGKLKTTLTAGNYNNKLATQALSDYAASVNADASSVNAKGTYGAIQFDYAASNKLGLTASYNTFKAAGLNTTFLDGNNEVISPAFGTDKMKIWTAGATYKFDNNVSLAGLYAKNTTDNLLEDNQNKSYNVQLNYKGADAAKAGSFGVYAAYRQLGLGASFLPTYDGVGKGQKGYEIGANYTFDKNIVGTVLYFKGKDLAEVAGDHDTDASKLFGQVEFFF
jgi:hypothetical protein